MNKNMKRLLFLALVPFVAWGIGSATRTLYTETISTKLSNQDITITPTGTGDVILKDYTGFLNWSSGTPTEQTYIDLTSNVTGTLPEANGGTGVTDISTILVELTGDQTVSGVKTFDGQFVASSTSNGFRPCPVMTEAQRDAIASPALGDCVINSDTNKQNNYDGTAWGEVGGSGGGGSRLNLLDDSSFETGVANGTCTGCTASQETTIVLATTETGQNAASLKMAFSAASGDYTWTETTGSEYTNTAGKVSAWIKTSGSDCHFVEMVDGVESQTVPISSEDEWKEYIINGTVGTTSYGYRVECNTSITDEVYVDETFAGAATADTFDIGTAQFFGSAHTPTTTDCVWSNAASAGGYSGFAADADCPTPTVIGNFSSAPATKIPAITFSQIPAGVLKCSAAGAFVQDSATQVGQFAFSDGSTVSKGNTVFGSSSLAGDSRFPNIFGEFHYSVTQSNITVEIQCDNNNAGNCDIEANAVAKELLISCYHYPSLQKVVAAKCDGLECENDFSVNIANNGTITVGTKKPNTQWYDSIIRNSEGSITIDYTGLGLTSLPGHSVSNLTGYFNRVTAKSTTSITIETYDSSATLADRDVSVEIFRHNSDHNQFDQRFIPVTDQQTEMFFVNEQSNFWDATGNTNDFDISLGNGNEDNDMFIVEDSGGLTRIRAKQNIDLGISCMGRGATNTGITIRDSSANIKAFSETSTADLRQNPSARINLTKDDYVYCELQSAASRGGGIVVTARPSELKAFIGNLNPKEFVKTPGSNRPVRYVGTATCLVTGSGGSTIDKQGFGDNWLSSITDLSSGTCTITLEDVFSSTPICQLTDHSSSSLGIVWNVFENSATSIDVSCTASSTGAACTGGADFNISCDGVQ